MIDLAKFYEQGLIPGPQEDATSFLKRVETASALNRQNLSPVTQELFGFSIEWVPVFFSNKKLLPWEGAAIWISEGEIPHIQLRKHFFKTQLFQKDQGEFLAHESVHAARLLFEEPQFEEILAYQTSKNCFRRFWGPLFRSSKESSLFMAIFAGVLFCGWFFPWIIYLLPLSMLGYFIFRLMRNQHIFSKCLKKTSLPFMLCLTDAEIILFSKLSPQEIAAYLDKQEGIRSKLSILLFSGRFRR